MSANGGAINVLHVDDEPGFAEMAASFLEREDDRLTVSTATSAEAGLDRLTEGDVDCIVSDYDMPGRNGLEFLETVREDHPDLPFVLFTGKGNEEVASDAISAGVSDYLQKTSGTDQYAVLANRIVSFVEKYQAERARERNRALVEEATDVILVVGPDATIKYATPSAESVLGRPPEELVGTSGFEPIHPDDQDRVMETFADLVEHPGERRTVEFRYGRPDGTWIWAEARGRNLLESSVVDGIVVYTRDVTERKERETERKETNTVLRAVLENLPTGVLVEDAERNILVANDRLCSVLDVPTAADDLVDRDCVAAAEEIAEMSAMPDDFVARIEETIEEREPVRAEELALADGRILERDYIPYTLPEGEANLWLYRDVTERKERERELERYETLVETAAGGVFVQDENARYAYVNSYIEEQTGYDRDEIIGSGPSMFMAEEDIQKISVAIGEMLEGSREMVTFETEITTASGESVPAEGQLALLPSDDGFGGTVGVIRDITERKERERKLRREKERLEEFASVLSHDLRNPLNVAQGRLDLAREDAESEHLDAVARALDRMNVLIDDLLTLAREGEQVSELESIDLAELGQHCWHNVDTGDATLTTTTERTILADRSRLQQGLENLYRNAVDHGGEGVTVTVGDLPDGFYVADDGPGIPESEREQVFETGYSTSTDGTGFGLAIVKEIADAHGWDVAVTDSEEGGARFEVTGVEFD